MMVVLYLTCNFDVVMGGVGYHVYLHCHRGSLTQKAFLFQMKSYIQNKIKTASLKWISALSTQCFTYRGFSGNY